MARYVNKPRIGEETAKRRAVVDKRLATRLQHGANDVIWQPVTVHAGITGARRAPSNQRPTLASPVCRLQRQRRTAAAQLKAAAR